MLTIWLKILVVGRKGAGKTSIIRRLVENSFIEEYKPSLLADFLTYDVKDYVVINNQLVNLKNYDYPGKGDSASVFGEEHEKDMVEDKADKDKNDDIKTIKLALYELIGTRDSEEILTSPTYVPQLQLFTESAHGCVLVFDLTDRKSFDDLKKWRDFIKTNCGNIPMILAANKKDKPEKQWTVKKSQIEKIAKSFKCPYRYTSARTGENIKNLFNELLVDTINRYKTELLII